MSKNRLTLITGGLLLLVFLFLLFAYQVRMNEVAVVTTFGRISYSTDSPGLKARWPVPIQNVYKFDKRLQNFERKFDQSLTRDGKTILCTVFTGWRVVNPRTFLDRFSGDSFKAEAALENVVRNAKAAVLSQHNLGDLISSRPEEVKFEQIEKEMLALVSKDTVDTFGIAVELLGIKQLGLPENVTADVFKRMKAERETLAKNHVAQGEAEARKIRSDADVQRESRLSEARVKQATIRGDAEAQVSEAYKEFEKNPRLAELQLKSQRLQESLQNRTTLILDDRTPPLDLLKEATKLKTVGK